MADSIFNDSMNEIFGKAYLKKCLSEFNNNVMAASLAFCCGIGVAKKHFNNFGNPLTDESVTFQDVATRLREAGYEKEANFIEKIRETVGSQADEIVGQELGKYCGEIQYIKNGYCFPSTINKISCFFHIDNLPHPAVKNKPTVALWSNSHKNHFGIDITTGGKVSPLYAVCDGTIIGVGGKCNTIYLYDPKNDITFAYAHCSTVEVSAGKSVSRANVIGYSGQTGASQIHLHFEAVRGKNNRLGSNFNLTSLSEIKAKNANWIDPREFFKSQGLIFDESDGYGG